MNALFGIAMLLALRTLSFGDWLFDSLFSNIAIVWMWMEKKSTDFERASCLESPMLTRNAVTIDALLETPLALFRTSGNVVNLM